MEAAAENPVGRGQEGDREVEDRWRIRDLLADERCSRAVLDFLSTTGAGRRVPAEEDAGSEVPEWELRQRREREEEQEAEAEELGAAGNWASGNSYRCTYPRPPLWRQQARSMIWGRLPFFFSFVFLL